MSVEALNAARAERGQRSRRPPAISMDAAVVLIGSLVSTVQIWRTRARARRELAALSERELQDMGTNWSEIADEVGKSFWRA